MKLALYGESVDRNYYRALFRLSDQGKIDLQVFEHRGLRWFGIKLWHCSPLTRRLVEKLTGRAAHQREPSWGALPGSLLHPLRLLFRQNIVAAFAPYSIMGFYLLLLKAMGKNLIYFTSWPHWDGEHYVRKPMLGSRKVWELFLGGSKAVGVTRTSAGELARLGANARHIPDSVAVHLVVPPGKRAHPTITLLHVGRVVKEKGIVELCAVFESLHQRHPHLRLVVVGGGPEVANIEGRKGVAFKGHVADQEELVREYQAADIFVLNSFKVDGWEELFGKGLVEAMACGLPCIATDCTGPKELVEDGVNGFLIPQKDQQALHRKLEELILDADLRKRLGKRRAGTGAGFRPGIECAKMGRGGEKADRLKVMRRVGMPSVVSGRP